MDKSELGNFTKHMVARWYRPPEIILLEPYHDSKVDIWSAGCIFAELAYIWDDQ